MSRILVLIAAAIVAAACSDATAPRCHLETTIDTSSILWVTGADTVATPSTFTFTRTVCGGAERRQ